MAKASVTKADTALATGPEYLVTVRANADSYESVEVSFNGTQEDLPELCEGARKLVGEFFAVSSERDNINLVYAEPDSVPNAQQQPRINHEAEEPKPEVKYSLEDLVAVCAEAAKHAGPQPVKDMIKNTYGVEFLRLLPAHKYAEFVADVHGLGGGKV